MSNNNDWEEHLERLRQKGKQERERQDEVEYELVKDDTAEVRDFLSDMADGLGEPEYDFDAALEAIKEIPLKPHAESESKCLKFTRLDTVKNQDVNWTWKDMLAKGHLHLVAGEAGVGKSRILMNIAAILSRGGQFPGSTEVCEPGKILYLSAEDSATQFFRPQFEACGGNLSNFEIMDALWPSGAMMSLEDICSYLEEEIPKRGIKLFIIDPATAFMPDNADNNSVTAVRKLNRSLMRLAEKTGIAVLAVTHLNKSAGDKTVHRVLGSQAWVAAARIVLSVVEEDGKFKLGKIKSNITHRKGVFPFELVAKSIKDLKEKVVYAEFLEEDVDLTSELFGKEGLPKSDQAQDALREELKSGLKHRSKEVKERVSKKVGCDERTVERAAKEIAVKAEYDGQYTNWYL